MLALGSQGPKPIGNALEGRLVQLVQNVGSTTLRRACVGSLGSCPCTVVESGSFKAQKVFTEILSRCNP